MPGIWVAVISISEAEGAYFMGQFSGEIYRELNWN